jgi:hypothetical protein
LENFHIGVDILKNNPSPPSPGDIGLYRMAKNLEIGKKKRGKWEIKETEGYMR